MEGSHVPAWSLGTLLPPPCPLCGALSSDLPCAPLLGPHPRAPGRWLAGPGLVPKRPACRASQGHTHTPALGRRGENREVALLISLRSRILAEDTAFGRLCAFSRPRCFSPTGSPVKTRAGGARLVFQHKLQIVPQCQDQLLRFRELLHNLEDLLLQSTVFLQDMGSGLRTRGAQGAAAGPPPPRLILGSARPQEHARRPTAWRCTEGAVLGRPTAARAGPREGPTDAHRCPRCLSSPKCAGGM